MDRITLYFLSIFIYGLLEPELWRFTLGRRRRCCACPALLVGLVNRELLEGRALSLCSLLQQSSAKWRSAGWQPWVQSWSKLVLVTISPHHNQWSWTWQWGPSAGVKDESSPGLQEQFIGVLAAAGMGRASAWMMVPCVRLRKLHSQIFGAFTPPVSLLLGLSSTEQIVLGYILGIALE